MKRRQQNRAKNVRVSILIVDDHPIVREGLAMQISRQPGLEVCGEADGVAAALQKVAELQPKVAVIDIGLKDGNGIDLVQRIKARGDAVHMLVWSMYGELHYAERSFAPGALGFVTKDQPTEQVIRAIRQVAQGKIFLSETMQERLLRRTLGGAANDDKGEAVEIGCFAKALQPRTRRLSAHRPGTRYARHSRDSASESEDRGDLSSPHQGKAKSYQYPRTRELRGSLAGAVGP